MNPTTMPEALQCIDNLRAELKTVSARAARNFTRAERLSADLNDAKAQLKLTDNTCTELTRMVDALRAERDTWRAQASQ